MKPLPLRDVAGTLKVSELTVGRLVRAGSRPTHKVGKGGQLRVLEEEFESFLERQRIDAATLHHNEEVSNERAK